MDDDSWSWSFWEGPGPDDLAEYFAFEQMVGSAVGMPLPWSAFTRGRMHALLKRGAALHGSETGSGPKSPGRRP
jgi:hypothetical protein